MSATRFLSDLLSGADCCPWSATVGYAAKRTDYAAPRRDRQPTVSPFVYTPEQRRRRDESYWTIVQGVLAPVQFIAFALSLTLVLRFLATGSGYTAATASIIVKTVLLYSIMSTGALWERVVFGKLLFAPAFFWEDVFSMLVIALHTAYLAALLTHALSAANLMLLALAAYAAYVVNATQFVLKLRAVRREPPRGWLVGQAE